jgi:hypothetical protein
MTAIGTRRSPIARDAVVAKERAVGQTAGAPAHVKQPIVIMDSTYWLVNGVSVRILRRFRRA